MPYSCHSVITDNFPGATSLSDSLKVYQKFSQRIFCPPPHPQDTFSLQELPFLSTLLCPQTPQDLQASRMRFRPCLLPIAGGKRLLKSKLSERSQRVGGRSAHSQLVDGVLRDDRVGREVGDHVGATEAPGAGGGRLPLPGQRAQGHGAGSRRTAPHPGPRPAPARGARFGLRRTGGAGSADSRRQKRARRVARKQLP